MSAPQYYEVRVVRRRPVAEETDLVGPVEQLVRAVQAEGAPMFQLFAHSPAHRLYPVLTDEKSWVEAFVTTSEIQWGFGRLPQDPSHQVLFFNNADEPGPYVRLRIQFVLEGIEATGPGLVADVCLGTDAVVHAGADRTARLDRLFSALIEILGPDFGHVKLPGHPESAEWPNAPDVGWLTYLARPESAGLLSVPPPSVAVPFAGGVKILAAPGPAPDDYSGVADAITALRGVIASAG